MTFNFLWVIGASLFLGWWVVDLFFIDHTTERPARSWYSVPVIGLVMVITWVLIQLAQLFS